MFVTIQCFSYMNAYIGSGGATEAATFGSAALWGASVFYGAWVLPPLLALAGRRVTDWAMLVLGGLLFILSSPASRTACATAAISSVLNCWPSRFRARSR